MIRCDAGGQVCVVMLYRRIHRDRHRHGDQFSGARDVSFAASAGEQPVVADAVEALGQDVEQEAPDELVGATVGVRYEKESLFNPSLTMKAQRTCPAGTDQAFFNGIR